VRDDDLARGQEDEEGHELTRVHEALVDSRELASKLIAWVIDVARALGQSGVGVMMAAPSQDERDQIKRAGLDLARRGALADLFVGGGEIPSELESMIGVLLLTDEDGFNTLASTVLAAHPRLPVYRLAPHPGGFGGTWAKYDSAATLFPQLTEDNITRRYQAGSRVAAKAADGALPDGNDLCS
jgi:hypothetical protein